MRVIKYMASGEVHNYLNGIKQYANLIIKSKRGRWTLFAKLKITWNQLIKKERKLFFGIFRYFMFNGKKN